MKKFTKNNCSKCNYPIYDSVYKYSTNKYGFELCKNCQEWFDKNEKYTTKETKLLYLALKKRNLPIEIEKNDGRKTIDLAIPSQKVNIEVDGQHHNYDSKQALSDLMRTYYSFNKGYHTFRIPNSLIKDNLNLAADFIVEIILTSKKNIENQNVLNQRLKNNEFLEENIVMFLKQFFFVFDLDWGYTQPYIGKLNNGENLLNESLDNSNWNNRDELIYQYRSLINKLKRDGTFKRVFEKEEYDDMITAMFCDKNGIS